MSTQLAINSFKPAFPTPLIAGVRPANDMRPSVFICSISPIGHKKKFQGSVSYYIHEADGSIRAKKSTLFEVPAVPKGQYAVMQVFSSNQMIVNTGLIHEDMQARPEMPGPQSAQILAQSIIHDWTSTQGATGDTCLGIGVIAGPEPTAEELADLIRKQEGLFRRLVMIADDLLHKGESVNINNFHRKAAEWLGIDREWCKGIVYTETKHCISCGEQIRMRARKCKECGTDLAQYAIESGIAAAELKEQDPYIAGIVTSMKKRSAMKGKAEPEPSDE